MIELPVAPESNASGKKPGQLWSIPLLGRKLLARLLWPLMLLMALDAVASYYVTTHYASLAFDRALAEMAREVLLEVQTSVDGTLGLSSGAEQILLEDADDQVFYRVVRITDQMSIGDAHLQIPPGKWSAGRKVLMFDSKVEGADVRVALLTGNDASYPPQPLLVAVAETLNKRHSLFGEILAGVVLPQLVLALLIGGLVWSGVLRGLAPLRQLEQSIATRSHLDLSPVVANEIPGNVRPLVGEINALMSRLSEVLTFQNRFIADAAHQLRTPVAGLKAQIEIALRESDPERLKHSLTQIYMGVTRLSRLVAQLLSLARNEPNAIRGVQLELMDLNRLVLETTMEWVPEALRKGLDLGFDGADEPVFIKGDPPRLKELINNLFDNAIRYTPENGRVTARVFRDPLPTFALSDDGPAIPIEERQRVFERFHRLLGSGVEGSGLGLSIVTEIAKLHCAEVTLKDDGDGVGNSFLVSFPVPESLPIAH